jgi:hypothetical protein
MTSVCEGGATKNPIPQERCRKATNAYVWDNSSVKGPNNDQAHDSIVADARGWRLNRIDRSGARRVLVGWL